MLLYWSEETFSYTISQLDVDVVQREVYVRGPRCFAVAWHDVTLYRGIITKNVLYSLWPF